MLDSISSNIVSEKDHYSWVIVCRPIHVFLSMRVFDRQQYWVTESGNKFSFFLSFSGDQTVPYILECQNLGGAVFFYAWLSALVTHWCQALPS